MSYNRPMLLRDVLLNLRAQTVQIDPKQIFLFQDGAQSPFSSEIADGTLQKECIDVFCEIFPEGNVINSSINLGIAFNFDRAERHFFEEIRSPCALFFEDDLLLSERYLEALLQLAAYALDEPKVAYVGAYGDHRATLSQQKAAKDKIVPLRHKWGFALTRRQWERQKPIVDGYLNILRGRDYRARDVRRIASYFASLGFRSAGTSQDAMKDVASHVLGTTKVMCFPCFAKYAGVQGEHFNSAVYERGGYGGTVLFDEEVPRFSWPSEAELSSWIDHEQRSAKSEAQCVGSSIQAHSVEGNYGAQIANEADVVAAYRLLVHRDPKPETEINAFVGKITIAELRDTIVRSEEFLNATPALREKILSEEGRSFFLNSSRQKAFISASLSSAKKTNFTIARFAMYRALNGALTIPRGVDHHCLSISDSKFLGIQLGLGQAKFTEAAYPSQSMTDLSAFPDDFFDSCISDQVLEHVEGDPFLAVRESLRVVKPGGHIVHTTCMMNAVHGVPKDFWRFTPEALALLITAAGGEIVAKGGWGSREAQALIDLGFRAAAVPTDPTHPFHEIAVRNEPDWPITTWIVAKKA